MRAPCKVAPPPYAPKDLGPWQQDAEAGRRQFRQVAPLPAGQGAAHEVLGGRAEGPGPRQQAADGPPQGAPGHRLVRPKLAVVLQHLHALRKRAR